MMDHLDKMNGSPFEYCSLCEGGPRDRPTPSCAYRSGVSNIN